MSTWTVTLTGRAYKQLKKLPSAIQDLADAVVHDLEAVGPKPAGWDVRKTGDDEYRVTSEQSLEIEIFYAGHRKDAYR